MINGVQTSVAPGRSLTLELGSFMLPHELTQMGGRGLQMPYFENETHLNLTSVNVAWAYCGVDE